MAALFGIIWNIFVINYPYLGRPAILSVIFLPARWVRPNGYDPRNVVEIPVCAGMRLSNHGLPHPLRDTMTWDQLKARAKREGWPS